MYRLNKELKTWQEMKQEEVDLNVLVVRKVVIVI